MLRYENLKHRPAVLRALTGLSGEEFEALYERFPSAREEAERRRLSRPGRERAIGAGSKYKLDGVT